MEAIRKMDTEEKTVSVYSLVNTVWVTFEDFIGFNEEWEEQFNDEYDESVEDNVVDFIIANCNSYDTHETYYDCFFDDFEVSITWSSYDI